MENPIGQKHHLNEKPVLLTIFLLIVFLLLYFIVSLILFRFEFPPQFTSADRMQLQQLLLNKKDYAGALTLATKMSEAFPNVPDVWLFKGIAQFETNQFASAKVSFDKVLSLDPSSTSAKNYEKALPQPGVTLVTATPLAQKNFEADLGLKFDPAKLAFSSAFSIPPEPTSKEGLSANYNSTLSLSSVTSYLTSLFGLSSQSPATSTQVIFQKNLTRQKLSCQIAANQTKKSVLVSINCFNQ